MRVCFILLACVHCPRLLHMCFNKGGRHGSVFAKVLCRVVFSVALYLFNQRLLARPYRLQSTYWAPLPLYIRSQFSQIHKLCKYTFVTLLGPARSHSISPAPGDGLFLTVRGV